MDDMILIHRDKSYLQHCLKEIENKCKRASSKQRLKRHLKTLKKLRDKDIVDDNYVYIRKNAFYNHIKDTKESQKLKEDTFPKKS